MSDFIKPTVVVSTALGILAREVTLPALVWRNAVGDFRGAFDDTISLRLPAFATARTRSLRSGASRTQDSLFERKVDLTLDTDIYMDVPISDEELTLDIVDFAGQVLNPIVGAVARKYEDELASTISGATYVHELDFDPGTDDAYETAVAARARLNNGNVPFAGRARVVGSEFESAFLTSDKLVSVADSGSAGTLREALIGRIAGFDVYASNSIASDEAYAFHQTAYALATAAPVVPSGVPWGASSAYQGMALRTVRIFDADAVADRVVVDAWTGSSAVQDHGHWDGDPEDGGKFVPVEDPDDPITGHTDDWANDEEQIVRAVKITVVGS